MIAGTTAKKMAEKIKTRKIITGTKTTNIAEKISPGIISSRTPRPATRIAAISETIIAGSLRSPTFSASAAVTFVPWNVRMEAATSADQISTLASKVYGIDSAVVESTTGCPPEPAKSGRASQSTMSGTYGTRAMAKKLVKLRRYRENAPSRSSPTENGRSSAVIAHLDTQCGQRVRLRGVEDTVGFGSSGRAHSSVFSRVEQVECVEPARSGPRPRNRYRAADDPRDRCRQRHRPLVRWPVPQEIPAKRSIVCGPTMIDRGQQSAGLVDLGIQVIRIMQEQRLERARLARALPLEPALVARHEMLHE